MLLKAGNLNYHVECFKILIHLNSKKFKIHNVDMYLTLISGMGFLDRIFFSFALNAQNVNYLHKKNITRPRSGMRGERKRYGKNREENCY